MSAAVPYTPASDFSEDEADDVAGRSTVLTPEIDAEYSAIAVSISSLITKLSAIQRDDNLLQDALVQPFNFSSAALALIGSSGFTINAAGGIWQTATAYAARDIVMQGTGTYVAAVAHTSGVFATDFAANKWIRMFDTVVYLASGITFTPTGDIASTNVQAGMAELDTKKLAKSQNLSDVQSTSTSRGNLSVRSKLEALQLLGQKALATGTADVIAGAFTPTITDLSNSFLVFVKAIAANGTTTPTFQADATAAKTIQKLGGVPLVAGDIAGSEHVLMLYWDPVADNYFLLNPGVVSAAEAPLTTSAARAFAANFLGGLF